MRSLTSWIMLDSAARRRFTDRFQHYYEQREFQELAAEMQVTKGRVSQLHAQALERIRDGVNVRPRVDRKV